MQYRFTIDGDLEGYQNVNPFTQLDSLDLNECSYIFCDNSIRGIEFENFSKTFSNWLSRLRFGGKIAICGQDANLVALRFIENQNLKELNEICQECNSLYTCRFVEEELKKNGLKIVFMQINDTWYNIEAERC